MSEPLHIGDVVSLRSGGPPMTISNIVRLEVGVDAGGAAGSLPPMTILNIVRLEGGVRRVACLWFVGDELRSMEVFAEDLYRPSDDPDDDPSTPS